MKNIKYSDDLVPFVCFDYKSPYESFNRDLVLGRLSKLFTVKNVNKYAVALYQIVGNRLKNVVVVNDKVVREILKSKVLKESTTFMPMNKMNPKLIPNEHV